jgi:hypothetical protein
LGRHAINSRTRRAHNKRNKRRYLNKAEATAACFDDMRPYLCPVCDYWHVGHSLQPEKWKEVRYRRGDLVCFKEFPDFHAVVTIVLSAHRVELCYLTPPPQHTVWRWDGRWYDECRKERLRLLTDEEAAPYIDKDCPPSYSRRGYHGHTLVTGSGVGQSGSDGGGHDR